MSPAVILSFIISKITLASGGHKEVEVDITRKCKKKKKM